MEQQTGGVGVEYILSHAERSLAASEFDYLQEEFLAKRHLVEKCQDVREKEGYTTTNANIGFQIREGLAAMRELLAKLKEEHRRLTKKKVPPRPPRRTPRISSSGS